MSHRTAPAIAPRPTAIALAVASAFAMTGPAHALPVGEQVVAGQVTVQRPSTGTMTILQGSAAGIVNWRGFSIANGERVQIQQPGASSVLLNRVFGGSPSDILGQLTANGTVFLLNPSGILFAPGSQVSVGSLVASTLSMSDDDFLAGRYRFAGSGGAVTNNGTITAADRGTVALLGGSVVNGGRIEARLGTVALAAGAQMTLDLAGDGLSSIAVTQAAVDAQVANGGAIVADGGAVLLTAHALNALVGNTVNQTGIVRAHSLVERDGRIVLDGGDGGTTMVSGTLDATGPAGAAGGVIQVLGTHVGLTGTAMLDASGDRGGGTVLVGGDYQGGNAEVPNAKATFVGPSAAIHADARVEGDGGKVIVWGDDVTRMYGTITARGGSAGGDGGFVETSARALDVAGARVDAGASRGESGQWLLDPLDVAITNNPTRSIADPTGPVFIAVDNGANVNPAVISAALNTNTSVTVSTGARGSEAGNLTIGENVVIAKTAGGGAATLRLNAHNDISVVAFDSAARIVSSSGPLTVEFNSDSDANGSGVISLYNFTVQTNGGNLTLFGGSDPVNGRARSSTPYASAVSIYNTTIDTRSSVGGTDGNVVMRGTGGNGSTGASGADGAAGIPASSESGGAGGAGGSGGSGVAGTTGGFGVSIAQATINAGSGRIVISGVGGDGGAGGVGGRGGTGGVGALSCNGDFCIDGTGGVGGAGGTGGAGGGAASGIQFNSGNEASGTVLRTTSGSITIDGRAGAAGAGGSGGRGGDGGDAQAESGGNLGNGGSQGGGILLAPPPTVRADAAGGNGGNGGAGGAAGSPNSGVVIFGPGLQLSAGPLAVSAVGGNGARGGNGGVGGNAGAGATAAGGTSGSGGSPSEGGQGLSLDGPVALGTSAGLSATISATGGSGAAGSDSLTTSPAFAGSAGGIGIAGQGLPASFDVVGAGAITFSGTGGAGGAGGTATVSGTGASGGVGGAGVTALGPAVMFDLGGTGAVALVGAGGAGGAGGNATAQGPGGPGGSGGAGIALTSTINGAQSNLSLRGTGGAGAKGGDGGSGGIGGFGGAGILVDFGRSVTTTSGDIDLFGIGGAGGLRSLSGGSSSPGTEGFNGTGVLLEPAATLQTQGGDISVFGLARSVANNRNAIGVDLTAAILTTGGGGSIDVRGRSEAAGSGLLNPGLRSTGSSLATSGSPGRIRLSGETTSNSAAVVVSNSGNSVGGGTTSGDILIRALNAGAGDAIDLENAVIETTGHVNLRPGGVSATGTLTSADAAPINLGNPTFAGENFVGPFGFALDNADLNSIQRGTAGIVIGGDTHVGAITANLAYTWRSDLTLQNGGAGSAGIALTAPLTSPGNAVMLASGGPVTQSAGASITAARLLLNGTQPESTFQLQDPGNDVASLAARFEPASHASPTGSGGVSYVNSAALTIGPSAAGGAAPSSTGFDTASDLPVTVTAVSSNSDGAFFARSLAGNLNLTQSISTLAGDITLVSSALFTNAGGSTLTPGPDGRWRVYADTWGDLPSRGGLTANSPNPNFYGCAYGAANCASGVSIPVDGNHFIYAQRPTATVTAASQQRSYGEDNPTPSFLPPKGLVNDDTAADAFRGSLQQTATRFSPVGPYPITTTAPLTSPVGYRLVFQAGVLEVSQAALTIFANSMDRAYGEANRAPTRTVIGLVPGDSESVISGGIPFHTATDRSNVGQYSILLTDASATNYSITRVPGTLSISQAPLTIGANDQGRLYGNANPTPTRTVTGLVPWDTESVVTGGLPFHTADDHSNVGNYPILLTDASATNYRITRVPGTLSISQAPLTIGANDQGRLYGDANPVPTRSLTGLVPWDTDSVVSGGLPFHTADDHSNVGNYPILLTDASATNYRITRVPGTLSISQAPLTIGANDQGRLYGDANPTPTRSLTGLVPWDTDSVVTGGLPFHTADDHSNVGNYPILLTDASATNYRITRVPGTLSIAQAPLTISANDQGRLYGDANPVPTRSLTGLAPWDTDSVITGGVPRQTAVEHSNVGKYPISLNDASATNYRITLVPGTLSILQAPLTISANGQSRLYGEANPAPTRTVTGLVPWDTDSVITGGIPRQTAVEHSNVGSYPIVVSDASAGNYRITIVPGALSVTPAPLTVAADDQRRLEGTINPPLTATFSGLVAGDTPAVADAAGFRLTTPSGAASPPGRYAITPASFRLANYDVTELSGTLTVLSGGHTEVPTHDLLLLSSDLYERNRGVPAICTPSDPTALDRAASGTDILSIEWSRVRQKPNVSNCLDLGQHNGCSDF